MGWLFGRKKKKKNLYVSNLHDDKSLNFGAGPIQDNILKPDELKAAAGLGSNLDINIHDEFKTEMHDDSLDLDNDSLSAWGKLPDEKPVIPALKVPKKETSMSANLVQMPRASASTSVAFEGHRYIQVQLYKRILGELQDLGHELDHMKSLSKSLEKAEYNEDKDFMKLKDLFRKIHDKILHIDRVIFGS